MSSRAQTRAQAVTPPAARGLKRNRRDKPGRQQLRAVYGQDLAHNTADASVYDANQPDGARAESEPRFGHDFSRLSVAPAPVPSQLFISQPQDADEQQARRLARDAMTMPVPQSAIASVADTSRQPATEPRQTNSVAETDRRESIDADTQSRLQALSTGGHKLPAAARDFFEPRLGFDFSRVRIHSDASAAELAADLDARAFTLGQHIVFNRDACGPETTAYRSVLAHELAHITQQTDQPQVASAQIHKDAASQPSPAQTALAKALRGDDDDTRDLTHHTGWPGLEVTPEQAALLLIHLLDGPTGDDDEQAGLKILAKMVSEKRLDNTLESLQAHKYFGQLFDDYDGSEYTDLLKLLAANITRRNVRAWTLDKFLSMGGTNQKEEEAIVVVLENGSIDDKSALLATGHRLERLRKTIDNQALAVRLEKVIRDVHIQLGQDLTSLLLHIFEAKAKASVAGKQRTQEEVDYLLKQAADDLTDELFDYQLELAGAIYSDDHPSPDKIARINDRFQKRLDELVETKSAEFDLEIKYNLEFNRLLKAAYSRTWSKKDLQKMDEILAEIPPEILHANPSFRLFSRADLNPDDRSTSGITSGKGRQIRLLGGLDSDTVAHELGHTVHEDEPALLTEFEKLSQWQQLAAGDFAVVVFDEKARKELLAQLDEDRKEKREYSRREYGKDYFRYDRYDKYMYWQYDKKACFISAYAETHPEDDFAESFAEYLVRPARLKAKCLDKYKFMHIEVFVKYWLNKQTTALTDRFNDEMGEGLAFITRKADYRKQILTKYLKPLRDQLTQDLTTLAQTAEAEATAALDRALPLKGSTKVEDVGGPYFKQLKDIQALAASVSGQLEGFDQELDFRSLFVTSNQTDAFKDIREQLMARFINDGLALLDPLVERIRKGEHVEKTPWPELQTQSAAYTQSAINAANYLDVYAKAKDASIQLGATDAFGLDDDALEKVDPTVARRFKRGDKRREPIRQSLIDNSAALTNDMKKLMADIMAQIQSGKPPKKGDKSLDANVIIQTRLKELQAKPKK